MLSTHPSVYRIHICMLVYTFRLTALRLRSSVCVRYEISYTIPGSVRGSGSLPFNPISGTSYKGINLILLMGRSWEDPRWMTYKQAQENLQTA